MGLNPSLVYGKEKDFSGNIVVSSIQTLSKFPAEVICDMFDVVLIDECHRVSSFTGTYYKTLTSLLAPMRIGVTATKHPKGTEAAMAMEGLIGPIIGEFTMEAAQEAEILAKPKVKLIHVPKNTNILDLRNYQDIYKTGIVNNRLRNKAIAKEILLLKQEGKTCLVYINQIEHIAKICNELDTMSVAYEIVQGDVDSREREIIKKGINDKILHCVIASTAWKEGVNIPTIDAIILAGGGKSDIAVVQTMGRGLRRAPGKTEILLVDFIDESKYLSEHLAARLNIYAVNGWLA
jgi:superfamily II DNA or RNA helicase